jgi:predicted permease
MLRDLRHAWRATVQRPLLSATIVLSLGVGIGVNTTVFSFVQARILRPLPGVAQPTSLSLVEPRTETGGYPGASWPEYRDLRERLRAFSDVVAFRIQALTVGEAEAAERMSGLLVSGNYFTALGVRAAVGRVIDEHDARRPGGEPVVVLSYEYWRDRLARDTGAVGRSLRVNGRDLTIVGVAPDAFKGTVIGMRFDMWVPATLAPVLLDGSRELDVRAVRGYQLAGRLAPTATTAQAQTELDVAMRELAALHPDANKGLGGELLPFWESPRGPQRMLARALALMQGLMVVLLLAVCGNAATLLLSRAGERRHEVAVRLALGANPGRVARLLLIEHALLALLAGGVGTALAIWLTPLMSAIPLTTGFPVRMQAGVDADGLLFSAGLAIVSAVVFGLAPAWHLSRSDPQRALRLGMRSTTGEWLRYAILGAQVALALVVLVAAGAFLRGLWQARAIDPGFSGSAVLLARYDLTSRSVTPSASRQFAARALAGLTAQPGVQAAAIAQQVPLDIHGLPLVSFTVEGRPRSDVPDRAINNVVTPGYFATIGVPLLAGDDFVPLDDSAAPRQAIVNDAFVSRYLPARDAVGRRLEVGGRAYVIVGVVRTIVSEAFGEPPTPCIYFSYRDRPAPVGQLHVRAVADPRPLAPGLRALVGEIDRSVALYDLRTLDEHVNVNLALRRIPARLFMGLGPLLLALAGIGIYAVVAGTVMRRAPEIGVRLALGATPGRVVSEVMGDTMWRVVVGAAAGWAVAAGLYMRLRASSPDPVIFAAAPVLLLLVALAASWWPARRAARIDPVAALRVQ